MGRSYKRTHHKKYGIFVKVPSSNDKYNIFGYNECFNNGNRTDFFSLYEVYPFYSVASAKLHIKYAKRVLKKWKPELKPFILRISGNTINLKPENQQMIINWKSKKKSSSVNFKIMENNYWQLL